MKTTALLPAAVLAYTAAAEMQLYAFPSPDKRDLETVNTALSQISNAITQLDTSVMAFDKDGAKVKADTENLVSTIKDSASAVASSGAISLEEALGLQTAATSLTTSGQKLLKDVLSKKAEFEASDICEDVQSKIASLGSETQSFVDAIIKQLPEESQQAAKGLTSGISSSLTTGAEFLNCRKGDDMSQTSSSAVPVVSTSALADTYPTSSVAATPTETCIAITVTVTAPCDCATSSSSVPVLTPSSSSSVPVLTPSISVPYPTGSNSTTVIPTGGVTTTSVPTGIATAAAGSNGVGAAGLLAGLAAALFV